MNPSDLSPPEQDDSERERVRSPAYPAISLRDAVEKIQQVWKTDMAARLFDHEVAERLEISPSSSAHSNITSSWRKFGLIEEMQASLGKRMRLTQTAEVLCDPQANELLFTLHAERAALSPAIYRELVIRFGRTIEADDETMAEFLINLRKFNPRMVEGCLKDYRDTMDFAQISRKSGIANAKRTRRRMNDVDSTSTLAKVLASASGKTLPMKIAKLMEQRVEETLASSTLQIPLEGGEVVTIPAKMSKTSFDLLVGTLNLWKSRLISED